MAYELPMPVDLEVAPGADLTLGPGGWAWQRYTSTVTIARRQVTIEDGRPDQFSTAVRSRAAFDLDGRDLAVAGDHPLSNVYERFGLNTPIRFLATRAARPVRVSDPFSRVTVDQWGFTPEGHQYVQTGSAGFLSSDFQTTGSAATHSVPSASAFVRSRVYKPFIDAEVGVRMSFPMPTGGALEPGVSLREVYGSSSYYLCRASVAVGGAVTAQITTVSPSATLVSVPTSIVHAAGTPLNIVGRADGSTISLWLWQGPASARPDAPTTQVVATTFTTAGIFGVRSGRGAGNTNTGPQFTYDDLTISVPPMLHGGWLTDLPEKWVGDDQAYPYIAATSSGALSRLEKGRAVSSPLIRSWTSKARPQPVAYWPMDDERGSTTFAAITPNTAPAQWTPDTLSLASDATLAGSRPLPTLNATVYSQGISPLPPTLATMAGIRWVYKVPSAPSSNVIIMNWETPAGNIVLWQVRLRVDLDPDGYEISGYNINGALMTSAVGTFAFTYGQHVMFRFNQTQNGGDVNYSLDCYTWHPSLGGLLGVSASGIVAALAGSITRWYRFGNTDVAGHTLGHVAIVDNTAHGASDEAPWGYPGESARFRIANVSAENGILTDVVGLTDTQLLGPRPMAKPIEMYRSAEATDLGVLYEYGWLMSYLSRAERYNAPVALTLDHARGQVRTLERANDDRGMANDVTVQRQGGTSATRADPAHIARYQRYETTVTVSLESDAQVGYQADMRLFLGTHNGRRVPKLVIDLYAHPELLDAVVALTPGARIQVINPPRPLPPDPIDLVLEARRVTFDGVRFLAELTVSSWEPWRLGNLDASRLDGVTSTLTGALSATAMSFQVATADGVLWTTSGGQFPMVVTVGGEDIRLSAISGASSPQTFTVDPTNGGGRAANGVRKAHAAGAQVRVKHPIRLAL